jgi:hypothetical protein
MTAYNAAVATIKAKADWQGLIAQFRTTTEFSGLAPRTQADYQKHLKVIEAKLSRAPIAALGDRHIRGDFKEWRDALAKKPQPKPTMLGQRCNGCSRLPRIAAE